MLDYYKRNKCFAVVIASPKGMAIFLFWFHCGRSVAIPWEKMHLF